MSIIDQHHANLAAAILELERAATPAEAAELLASLVIAEVSPYVYRGSAIAARIRSYLGACAAQRATTSTDHPQPALFPMEATR